MGTAPNLLLNLTNMVSPQDPGFFHHFFHYQSIGLSWLCHSPIMLVPHAMDRKCCGISQGETRGKKGSSGVTAPEWPMASAGREQYVLVPHLLAPQVGFAHGLFSSFQVCVAAVAPSAPGTRGWWTTSSQKTQRWVPSPAGTCLFQCQF